VRDRKAEFHAIGAADFEAWIRRLDVQIDFLRSSTGKVLMGAEVIVPTGIGGEESARSLPVKGNEDSPGPFVFEGTDESLDHSDAAVSAHGAVTRLDPPALAPSSEGVTVELRAFVGDEMLWRVSGLANGAAQEGTNLQGRGFFPEDGESHNRSRKMIDHESHMPYKRPDLRQREGKPRNPAACRGPRSFGRVNQA